METLAMYLDEAANDTDKGCECFCAINVPSLRRYLDANAKPPLRTSFRLSPCLHVHPYPSPLSLSFSTTSSSFASSERLPTIPENSTLNL